MKIKIGAIILKNNKILAVRKQGTDVYIMPGGKPEGSETHEQTIERELKEELGVKSKISDFFGTFIEDDAILKENKIEMHVYFADIFGEIKPQSEIEEVVWIGKDYKDKGFKYGSILEKHVISKLIQMGALK